MGEKLPEIMAKFKDREPVLIEELHFKYDIYNVEAREKQMRREERQERRRREANPELYEDKENDSEDMPFSYHEIENKLSYIYSKYNPDKLDKVQEIMDKFAGREMLLLRELYAKYNIPIEEQLQAEQKEDNSSSG